MYTYYDYPVTNHEGEGKEMIRYNGKIVDELT